MEKSMPDANAVRKVVRENYAKIAQSFGSCCNAGSKLSCCGSGEISAEAVGYSKEQIALIPEVAQMGLGCGNPQAIAELSPGEVVLDLGSGAGFDAILAAKAVGEKGRVIGVDMTAAMIEKARRNAAKSGITNIEFRSGEIEQLPVEDDSVDVIISNCVVNLSPDKAAVFREAYRVLKPGGRIAISDVVALRPLPVRVREDKELYCACIGGAAQVDDLRQILQRAGFEKINITTLDQSRDLVAQWTQGNEIQGEVISALIKSIKP